MTVVSQTDPVFNEQDYSCLPGVVHVTAGIGIKHCRDKDILRRRFSSADRPMLRPARRKRAVVTLEADVVDLTHDGEGVLKIAERVYFVPGALPGERVRFTAGSKRRGKFIGRLEEILQASPHRTDPECAYFGVCGGCTLQHLDVAKQRESKEKILLDNLERIGRVTPALVLPLLSGNPWHYRRKARPGCKHVPGKGGILVGFRERGLSYLTSLRSCLTLDARLAGLLDPLHELIAGLDCARQVPQLEFAAGDNAVAIVLRHLVPLTGQDVDRLTKFAREQSVQMQVQPAGPDSIRPLWPLDPVPLQYRLTDYDVTLEFAPTDFIQVNGGVNVAMVRQAMDLLRPEPGDHVLDLFCGLGNFTLPMARLGARVTGVEGEPSLVDKGAANARANGLDNIDFLGMDLYAGEMDALANLECSKLLLDPPRSGALEVVENLVGQAAPDRIVYVSCNPATLARDAGILVHRHGYVLSHAGAIDMFPHTSHVESMAVFRRTAG